MGRPKEAIGKIAEELDVDQKTVRRALEVAGMSKQQAEADFNGAVEIVRLFVDKERVIWHQAGRVTTNPTIANSRTRLEELKAKQLELEIQQAEGRLIDRQAVTETGVCIIASVRTALLALGYRLADKVAGKTDTKEIARIIEADMRDVLGALADETVFFDALEAEALS